MKDLYNIDSIYNWNKSLMNIYISIYMFYIYADVTQQIPTILYYRISTQKLNSILVLMIL